jgi:hypothetical protein
VRPVVSAVEKQRVIGNTQCVEQGKDLPDVLVMVDHHVVVFGLPTPGLTHAARLLVSAEMHVGGVDPDRERLAGVLLARNPVRCHGNDVIVDGFHALLGQRAGILDLLRAVGVGPACSTPRGPNFYRKFG